MGELGLNKVFGALLAVALAVLGLQTLSSMVFGGGGHYGHHYESANEWAEKNFAYRVNIAEAGGGAEEEEEVYDLGLLLASADLSRGERSFKGKCATCHTIDQGGVNGTGPNLYDTIGAPKEHIPGFNYSGALAAVGGDWTYQAMDDWLRAPSRYARGTSMAFAGISRDDERASLIAYLASYTPDAPAFPEPLPAVAEDDEAAAAETDGGAAEETASELQEETAEIATEADAAMDAGVEAAEEAIDAAEIEAEDAAEAVSPAE